MNAVRKRNQHSTLEARLNELFEWYAAQGEGWSTQNIVHRLLRDPGVATDVGGHRILHEVPRGDLKPIHDAFVLLMPFGQRALYYRYGWARHEDGSLVTTKDRADAMGLSVRSWERLVSRARTELMHTMRNPPGVLTAKARAWD